VRANARVFILATISIISAQYIVNVLLGWMPTFFMRTYGTALHEVGLKLGLLFSVCSVSGFLLSGILSDRYVKRGDYAGRIRPLAIAMRILIPLLAIWPLMGTFGASFAIVGVVILAASVALGTLPTTLQEIAPNRMRGQVVTLAMLIGSLVGWGAGPTVPALITDYVFHNEAAIGYSLAAATVPIAILASITSWLAARPYAALRQRVLLG
jgi:hypothetical protein